MSFRSRLLKVTLAFAAVAGSGAASASSALPIRFKGVSPAQIKHIRAKYPGLFHGELKYYDGIDRLLREMMQSQNFQNIEADLVTVSGRKTLLITAKPLKTIGSIVFKGNHKLSLTQLSRVGDLHLKDNFNETKIKTYANQLKKFYADSGFLNAEIEIVPTVNIKENQPCRITKISFATENTALKQKLDTMNGSLVGDYYSREIIAQVLKKVRVYLEDHRYFRIKLLTPKVSVNPAHTQAQFTFPLGNPFRYEFLFRGNHDPQMSSSVLITKILDSPIRASNADPSQFTASLVKDAYLSLGYAKVNVDADERTVASVFEFITKRAPWR